MVYVRYPSEPGTVFGRLPCWDEFATQSSPEAHGKAWWLAQLKQAEVEEDPKAEAAEENPQDWAALFWFLRGVVEGTVSN